jgi:hypothetical protein
MARRRSMLLYFLTSFVILTAFPFYVAFGQTGSDIRQYAADTSNRKAPMQVPVVINPDGSRTYFHQGEPVTEPPPAANPTNKYCEELTKEGVTGADWARYCK